LETLLAFIACAACEVIEDILVGLVSRVCPAPIFQTFSAEIIKQGNTLSPFSTYRMFSPKAAAVDPDTRLVMDHLKQWQACPLARMPKQEARRLSLAEVDAALVAAPNLMQVRPLTFFDHLSHAIAVSEMVPVLMTLGLGYGAAYGHCDPTEDTWLLVRNLAIWMVTGCDE